MFHKPYIYLILLSFVIWIVNYFIIKSSKKNDIDYTPSIIAIIVWAPIALTFGIMGLLLK